MFKQALTVLLSLATTLAMAAVDVNTASEADLDSIKGIGPGTTAKILEQRKTGKFKDWNDLIQRVSGIGEKRAAKLSSDGLTVNGTPFKAGDSPKPGAGNKTVTTSAPSKSTATTPKQ